MFQPLWPSSIVKTLVVWKLLWSFGVISCVDLYICWYVYPSVMCRCLCLTVTHTGNTERTAHHQPLLTESLLSSRSACWTCRIALNKLVCRSCQLLILLDVEGNSSILAFAWRDWVKPWKLCQDRQCLSQDLNWEPHGRESRMLPLDQLLQCIWIITTLGNM
jgi:hypothetical protein